ncbi:shikimate kinase [Flavobacterium sp.]|uniref:shikimate kinase n=1 Tax=Flavobacterium sp. TaxID=239 RepID=UPI003F697A48
MKIVLVGYMGVGKTSIAKKLIKKVRISSLDLDHLIENKENMTINQLFLEQGEIYFRKLEHEIFHYILDTTDEFVLSLGGGTPCYSNNHLLLQRADVLSIYLKSSVNCLTEKLKNKRGNRPLIKDLSDEALQDYIAKHLFDRSYYYHQAKHVINVDNKSKKDIVNEILSLI